MNAEIRHLRAVTPLAEAESFTVTAAMLGTTQLTLSRTLTQLEKILEIRLVACTTWEHSLTPAGERFVASARDLLASHDDTVADLLGTSRRRCASAGPGLDSAATPCRC